MLSKLDRSKLPGTWLLIGEDAIEQAHLLARSILETKKSFHPDLAVYCPEGKAALHPIASMRRFSESVPRVTIIEHADRMLPTSANALLKTFEEPPLGAVILLTTRHPYRLLPTILSRCRRIQLEPAKRERRTDLASLPIHDYNRFQQELATFCKQVEIRRTAVEKETLERLSFPEMGPAQKESVNKQAEGAAALAYLHEVERLLEDLLLAQSDLASAEPKVAAAWKAIQRHSRLEPTLESCFLSLTKI